MGHSMGHSVDICFGAVPSTGWMEKPTALWSSPCTAGEYLFHCGVHHGLQRNTCSGSSSSALSEVWVCRAVFHIFSPSSPHWLAVFYYFLNIFFPQYHQHGWWACSQDVKNRVGTANSVMLNEHNKTYYSIIMPDLKLWNNFIIIEKKKRIFFFFMVRRNWWEKYKRKKIKWSWGYPNSLYLCTSY